MIVNAALILFDILWLSTSGSSWGDQFPNAPVWNSTSGIRSLAVSLSVVDIFIKLLATLFIFLITRIVAANPEHENTALGTADYLGGGVQYDMRNVQPLSSGYYGSQSAFSGPVTTAQRFNSPGVFQNKSSIY